MSKLTCVKSHDTVMLQHCIVDDISVARFVVIMIRVNTLILVNILCVSALLYERKGKLHSQVQKLSSKIFISSSH